MRIVSRGSKVPIPNPALGTLATSRGGLDIGCYSLWGVRGSEVESVMNDRSLVVWTDQWALDVQPFVVAK